MARKWTKDEEILAFALYCKTPFGKMHSRNDEIVHLANALGRTPASVSMKLCNFARFDEQLRARGVAGLSNGSHLDEEVWNEFSENLESLEEKSKQVLMRFRVSEENEQSSDLPVGTTIRVEANARINQSFFRQTVLSNYAGACCITRLAVPALLTASHIKPWKDSNPQTERTNPRNGLCLNALHDRAFDRGLITVTTDYRVVVSKQIKEFYSMEIVQEFFGKYDGKKIELPEKFLPARRFIEFHNTNIFERLG